MNILRTEAGIAPEISDWLVMRGLAGDSVAELVAGLCQRLADQGVPLLRAFVGLQTLHPLYGGYAYVWRRGAEDLTTDAYLRQGGHNKDFLVSPFQHMRESRLLRFRQRLDGPAEPEFPIYRMFRDEGGTDYFVRLFPFARADAVEREDGVLISLLFDRKGGMAEDEIAEIEAILQVFALAARSAATYATALSVTSTYLGRDAGQRVMDGDIDRGSPSTMRAVIYYADLRGFTPLSEKLAGPDMLAMLDDYLDAIARGVLQRGGEVLKFLGDGVLAVFEIAQDDTECQVACQQGMAAGWDAFAAIDALNATREAQGQPTMQLDLAMHIGDVLYGNVGAEGRLDFTVIGPAVNEASRIEAMCGELDRNWLVSDSFFQSARHCSDAMEPMGRHQLRGLTGERALYSLPTARREQLPEAEPA
ncbi:MAG: adenylate/guanylate cyclase domain-containing protein [Alphaproteobacteria bacterium]|nr:adenylate/guanylate cyclase domain-containing protein [Alphaproteobacteria bacterium]